MNKEKLSYEGIIHNAYKKKNFLKLNILLLLIFTPIILLILSIYFDFIRNPRAHDASVRWGSLDLQESTALLFFAILDSVIIPYIVISIVYYKYLSSYVRNFTFIVSEDSIVIEHGVFTKTKVTIPYIRIQNINVFSGFFDRRFKLHTVKIATAGSDSSFSPMSFFKPHRGLEIPGQKEPHLIENKINEMIKKHSQLPGVLANKIFKPEELAFDNFISYILSKIREGEGLNTNVRALREKSGMSGAQLAEKVGVPVQTINYLEEGRYNPSLSLAYKIAQVLNCKIEDLFQLI
jgi:putative transcriptional regulator